MKDIGLKLKEKREENGVSVEEAAEDLKMRPSQIISLESGKKEDFKDVISLKYFIRDYAKYLGLDAEAIVDEFNEFLFDYTSKIPIKDIEEAKNSKKNEKKKVVSPYTLVDKRKFSIPKYVIIVMVVFGLLLIGYVVINSLQNDDFQEDQISYLEKR